MKKIRDFIYLDKDRVNSLYSQINEGVAEAIIDSYVSNLERGNKQRRPVLGDTVEERVGEYSTVTENKILHDHMYNTLENKLEKIIFIPENITKDNYIENLGDKFIIKIKGCVNIHNYNRMKLYLEKFNDIGNIVAYSQLDNKEELENKKAEYDRNKKVKEIAKENGLIQDKKLLDNLKEMIEIFNSDGFELIVKQECDDENIIYRVVLNSRYLRLNEHMLRILYTHNPSNEWIIVGQITNLPNTLVEDSKENEEVSGIRDAYKNMINVTSEFENIFFKSNKDIEITIAPVAIYREQEIDI